MFFATRANIKGIIGESSQSKINGNCKLFITLILVHIETFIQQRLCTEHCVAAYLHRGRAGEQLAPEGAESVGGGGVRGGAGGRGRGGGGGGARAAVHRVLARQPQPRQLLPDGCLAEPRERDLAALRLGRLVAGAGAGLRGGHHRHSLTGAQQPLSHHLWHAGSWPHHSRCLKLDG